MSDTRAVVSPQRLYSLIFPGTWAAIPLASDEAMKKRISALVKQRVGKSDRLARNRRSVTDDLVKTAKQAREGGAQSLSLSMEILPGIPFPAALVAADRPWPGAEITVPTENIAGELATRFPTAEILEHRMGPVARAVEIGEEKIGDTKTPSVLVEYWVPYPDAHALLNFTVSAPMAEDPGLYTLLFDAMIDSLTWAEPVENANGDQAADIADAGNSQEKQ